VHDPAVTRLGELDAIVVGDPARIAVVVLHGREMCGADLAPFAQALAADAYWIFPDAPLASTSRSPSGLADGRARTWWPVDSEARIRRMSSGPMELSTMEPEGRPEARALLDGVVTTLARPYVLAGFSQGGMLAMDYVLHGGVRPAALALLSSTRIAIADWQPRAAALARLPVLVAHGRADAELAFAAGEHLRDFAEAAGAAVTWLPFDGGHELPFVVWRGLRKLVRSLEQT
jgi:phospholipase/carboxylesterase